MSRPRRIALVLACAALLPTGGPSPAAAHLGSTKYVQVDLGETGVDAEVDLDAIDASMELGQGPDPDLAALEARADAIGAWVAGGIGVRSAGGRCRAEPGPIRMTERDGRPHVTVPVRYACPAPVEDLVLRDDTVFDDDPRHEAIVHVAGPAGSDAMVLRAGSRTAELGDPAGPWDLVGVFLWEGMLHLITGYDHVLFLLSLVLAAGFVVRRRGLRAAMRDVVVLVTAFTVGHSVTLIAAALQVVVLPSRPVEAIIAASIVAVALHNVARPEERRSVPWMAFFFGLIHGFGFSSVLAELGLPADQTVLALLSFNVGIELAQLAFVALVLGPIAWSARLPAYRNVVVRGGSIAIALVAGVWLVERVAG
ncbi:MAG: HupE/UreJ family protein [Myxococcota bacterium]